jgi:hypothetical protein
LLLGLILWLRLDKIWISVLILDKPLSIMKYLIAAVLLIICSSFFVPDTREMLCNKKWLRFADGYGKEKLNYIQVRPVERSKSYEYYFHDDSTVTQIHLDNQQITKQSWGLSFGVVPEICFGPLKKDTSVIFYPCTINTIERLTSDTLILGYNHTYQNKYIYYQYFVRVK